MLPELKIDAAEPNEMVLLIEEYPEYFPKFSVERLVVYDEELDEWIPVGDYTNEYKSFILERKVIHTLEKDPLDGLYRDGDFHTSLTKKRLQDQLAKMYLYYEKNRWLLAEGYLLNYAVKHPAQANFARSIIGHCGTMNICFRECYDKEDFLLNLYWINRESGSEPFLRQDVKLESKKVLDQISAFSRISSVGSKRAKIIFATYPSVEEIFNNVHQLHEIKGIGKTTENAIYTWLTTKIDVNSEKSRENSDNNKI